MLRTRMLSIDHVYTCPSCIHLLLLPHALFDRAPHRDLSSLTKRLPATRNQSWVSMSLLLTTACTTHAAHALQVIVYEERDYIGGRLKHTTMHNVTIELGGDAWSTAANECVGLRSTTTACRCSV
jgi:hypothetical protein